MNKKHIIWLVLFSFGIKFCYLLFPVIQDQDNSKKSLYDQYIGIAKKNDSYWYERIATYGYPEIQHKRDIGYSEGADFKQSEWAFFPAYPALILFTSRALNITFNNSAFIWSLIFSVLAILGLYLFGLIFFKDPSMAFYNALLLFSFPFSFYFSMFYTEALFFVLMIYSFICIYYRQYILLTLLLIPLTLVRPNGIIILLPLYLFYLQQNGILQGFKINWNVLFTSKSILQTSAFLSAPLAFIIYGGYQYEMTGYFFASGIAQEGWYREWTFPLLSFFRRGDLATQFNSIYTIIVIVYAVLIYKKLPVSLNILVLISIGLPLCSGSVTSMTRFISVIFPLFLVMTSLLYRYKFKYAILALILILHFLSFYSWYIDHPISF